MPGDCIVCGSADVKTNRGFVAPFLAHRIWGKPPFSLQLLHCKQCEFLYFTPRLSDSESERLYSQYRGASYRTQREQFEPWYTEALNNSLFSDAAMQGRRDIVRKILSDNLPSNAIHSVLDFGGGRGELIDGLIPSSEKFVYDIARLGPIPGVLFVELDDPRKFDLVICSNVFEHVASPRELLSQMLSHTLPGGWVFIEVPDESPLDARTRMKRVAQFLILTVLRTRMAVRLLRFRTLNVMHEHLNFYSHRSLLQLVQTANLEFVASGKYGETIWIIARVPV